MRIVRICRQSAVSEKRILCRGIRAIIICQTLFPFLLKPKKPKCDKAVSRSHLLISHFPRGQHQQGDKKQSGCCFRRRPLYISTARRRKQSTFYFRRGRKQKVFFLIIIVAVSIKNYCASNGLFFAPLATINYDLRVVDNSCKQRCCIIKSNNKAEGAVKGKIHLIIGRSG